MTQNTAVTADALRQEILKDEGTLRTLMTTASECYLELASGSGRGADIYAEYRENNLSTSGSTAKRDRRVTGTATGAPRATARSTPQKSSASASSSGVGVCDGGTISSLAEKWAIMAK